MGDIYTNPPQSRNEAILRATIDGTEYEAPPQSRMEDLLVELKAAIEQSGGIVNYNALNNKPKINSVTLQGDQSISDLFDGKVDIGVGTVEESGYAELKDENGDRIFRASSANGGASVESGALIGQPGALVLYNGEGGLGSVRPKGGVSLVDVDLPAENGTLALDSQIASSQTSAKAAVVTVNDAAPINAEDITVDITPVQDLHGYDKPWAGGAGKNKLPMTVNLLKSLNTAGSWSGNVYDYRGVTAELLTDNADNVTGIKVNGTASDEYNFFLIESNCYSYNGMTLNGCPSGGSISTYNIRFELRQSPWAIYAADNGSGASIANIPSADSNVRCFIRVNTNISVSNQMYYPMIRLATETDATFAPYSNECPIEGRTGAELTQKDDATNPTVTRTYSTDFGETVYGGKWHVTEGGTDKTMAEVDLGNLNWQYNTSWSHPVFTCALNDAKTFEGNSKILCSIYKQSSQNSSSNSETVSYMNDGEIQIKRLSTQIFVYDSRYSDATAFKNAMLGQTICYELATPTTISTPKQNVPMLQGINTVSADCGDTQLKYQPDNVIGELKGMIQALDARVTALEEAE